MNENSSDLWLEPESFIPPDRFATALRLDLKGMCRAEVEATRVRMSGSDVWTIINVLCSCRCRQQRQQRRRRRVRKDGGGERKEKGMTRTKEGFERGAGGGCWQKAKVSKLKIERYYQKAK